MLTKNQAIQKMNEKVAGFKSAVSPSAVTKIGARKGTPFYVIVDEHYNQIVSTLSDVIDNTGIVNEFENTVSGMRRRASQ